MAKPWHKKHIPTKWGVGIILILLLGLIIAISQLGRNQTLFGRAYLDPGDSNEKSCRGTLDGQTYYNGYCQSIVTGNKDNAISYECSKTGYLNGGKDVNKCDWGNNVEICCINVPASEKKCTNRNDCLSGYSCRSGECVLNNTNTGGGGNQPPKDDNPPNITCEKEGCKCEDFNRTENGVTTTAKCQQATDNNDQEIACVGGKYIDGDDYDEDILCESTIVHNRCCVVTKKEEEKTAKEIASGDLLATSPKKARVKVMGNKTYKIKISGTFSFGKYLGYTLNYDAKTSDKGKKGNKCYCLEANPIKWNEVSKKGTTSIKPEFVNDTRNDFAKHVYVFEWKTRPGATNLEMYIADSNYSDNKGKLSYTVEVVD